MAKNTYRIIVISAAAALGLAFTGPLAADDSGDEDDQAAQTTAPIVYVDKTRDEPVTKVEARVDETPDPAEFARFEEGGEWLRPRFVVHPGPHGPQ